MSYQPPANILEVLQKIEYEEALEVDIARTLDRNNVKYADVLMAMALQLWFFAGSQTPVWEPAQNQLPSMLKNTGVSS